MEGLILNLVSGAVGGNVVGWAIGSLNQGTMINSIAGILGGGLGGSVLSILGAPELAGVAGDAAGLDIGAIVCQIASGGVGGGILLAIVGFVRSKMG